MSNDNTPSNSDALRYLEALSNRPEVDGVWFLDKVVTLDGYNFKACRFDRCRLNLSSANFELINCHIDDSTEIYYSGVILKPIRLFNSRYQWVYEHMPFFAPERNPDGTISITS